MQNISLHNYQDFLLRYIDEELDLRETEALLAFVALHPEAQEELELLQSTKLDIETITCPSKALLYKNIFPVIVEPETIVYPHKQKLFKKEKDKAVSMTKPPAKYFFIKSNYAAMLAAKCVLLILQELILL
jgi:hypothetical protein